MMPLLLPVKSKPLQVHRTSKKYIRYEALASGIHEIVITTPAQEAINAWRDCLETVYAAPHATTTLTDATLSILPPLAYLTHYLSLWSKLPITSARSRNAILHEDGNLSQQAKAVVNALCADTIHSVRYFMPHQHDAALAWLADA